jgi:UDP-glucose 4-epimerase
MKILLTGSSGQLGRAIAECLANDHQVTGVDLLPGPYTHHVGGFTERGTIAPLLEGADAVIHTASLHARHISTHTQADFTQTNVQGILSLLEACRESGVRRFVYTSTTSLYGHSLSAPDRAVWVTEKLVPQPRDIYDTTKIAAEGLCQIFAANHGISCVSLRVGRFFPEPERLVAIYRLYRGLDVRDAAAAHRLALESRLEGYRVYNISARSPFHEDECVELFHDAGKVIRRRCPAAAACFAQRGWELPQRIDRVYVTGKAEQELGYRPRHNFSELLTQS